MHERLRLSLFAVVALPAVVAACARGPRPAPQLPAACTTPPNTTRADESQNANAALLVVGMVRFPGRYPAPPGLTLRGAIREAGGVTTGLPGSEEATVSRRMCTGKEVRVHVRVGDIFSGRISDLELAPEDVVHIAPCPACIY